MVSFFEGSACATQSTRLRDYKTTSGCRMMLRYRFADLCFAHASQTCASLTLRRLVLRSRFADYERLS